MESDYKILIKIGRWFLAKRYDLNSEPKYKRIGYFIGRDGMGFYSVKWEINV